MFFLSFAAIDFIPAVFDVTTWPTTSWTVSISILISPFFNEKWIFFHLFLYRNLLLCLPTAF